MLPEWHEQPFDLHPVLPGQFLFEREPGCFRNNGAHIAPPVGDAMDVNIDADFRRPAGNPKGEICAFGPDTAERRHYLEIAGKLSSVRAVEIGRTSCRDRGSRERGDG